MWIEDVTKALWMLNGEQLIDLIEYISNGIIKMTSGTIYTISELVEAYNKEYGE